MEALSRGLKSTLRDIGMMGLAYGLAIDIDHAGEIITLRLYYGCAGTVEVVRKISLDDFWDAMTPRRKIIDIMILRLPELLFIIE
jgi:hypothetical protein